MYKMIIVDDEYLVRYGIEQTIDWPSLGIEVVGDAKNGKEGLALALAMKPDIIISDVRMPLMDGLDFVKAIKENKLDTIVIMLSGYKDFEYAKETLENGAFSYLLKPIDNQELIDVVLKSIDELKVRRKMQQTLMLVETDKQIIASSILRQALINPQSIPDWLDKLHGYSVNLPDKGRIINVNCLVEGNKENVNNLAQSIKKHFSADMLDTIIIETDDNLIIITSEVGDDQLIALLSLAIEPFEKQGYIYAMGISSVYHELIKLPEYYEEAKRLSSSSIILSTSTILASNQKHNISRQLICDVLHYIANHYARNINIKTVADALYVSDSHLMHILKEELGKTFNECLTAQRMNVAKSLLTQGNALIYEVALSVGYSDAKYFSQVFKKYTGFTPLEYMQMKEMHK